MRRDLYINILRRDVRHQQIVVETNAVDHALSRSKGRRLQLLPMDAKYRALPLALWRRLIERSKIDKRTYKPEFFDCDDFAVLFMAYVRESFEVNGAGLVIDWSGRHAYNFLLVATDIGELDVAWLEPQNDVLMDRSPAAGMYAAEQGVIIL